ncbi:amino acid adenylation domain-containing protein [Paraburkholderia caledonica]|uniref:Amino acid adenylation domain-containing protein n=1 Tax=Paraburkholderia caledonica TaxID=134536 RepID=A0AB73II41_9BURK|nr:amino acid adenylation domain-containing protein [Paraburkholderia caledonica]
MRDDLFAGLKSLTAEQREALRLRLVERTLIDAHETIEGANTDFVVSPDDMARIAASVEGGIDNIEGVYPLTPLQEGMLFHHLLAGDHDPYMLHQGVRFGSRHALEQFVAALRAVVARHGILRSAMVWDALAEPVQVVWRKVELPLFEGEPEAGAQEAGMAWLARQSTSPRYRIDVAAAPLMRLLCMRDTSGDWLLVVASHHLIGDRASLDLMRDELGARMADASARPYPARQFGEYALAVRAAGDERDVTFFRELLGDVDEPTAPFGLLDAIDGRAPLAEARRPLDGALVRRMREQARRAEVGAPAIVHLAWSLVLARASGRDDVVFGTVLSGRMRVAAMSADMLGMLVNTLPFRAKLAGRGTLDCVVDAQRLLTQLVAHEHVPLTLARRASAIAPPTPLFGALLDYRHVGHAPARSTADAVMFAVGRERTSFPLTLSIDDSGETLTCAVQTFEGMGPARILDYFVEALRQVVDALEHAPWRAAVHIDVAPADSAAHRLSDMPPEPCIHRLFEAQAARTPHALCVVSDASSIDYATLDARANALAQRLRGLGVRTEMRVALCINRSIEGIVAMLAVMKAGGAYVPLDPVYPHERLRLLVRLSRPALGLVGGTAPREVFVKAGVPIIDLRESPSCPSCTQESGRHEKTLADRTDTPDQTAYVLFTSGSTGEPKGVAVEHRSVSAFARAHARWCGLSAGDRVLQFASHSFDNSVAEIFPALAVGAALVLRPDGPMAPDHAFAHYLERHAVTVADLPTAFWHEWAHRLGAGDLTCAPRPPLRLVLAGGEKLQYEALRKWQAAATTADIRMGDTYGLTEATVNSIVGELARESVGAQAVLPLGRPLGNTRAYVVDEQGRPVPAGVTGEIWIGGAGVARGYFDRPALTAARFVPDPFGPPGARCYRTGDLGRLTESGEMVYIGRADTQLKVRGYRIEPAEIEHALRTVPGVRDAKVIARGDCLVAYFVSEQNVEPHERALRDALMAQLPCFMVPAAFIAVSALPVNTHGKVDLALLRASAIDPPVLTGDEQSHEPPQSPAEVLVADIWRALLERDRVGRQDDFFALGGHSLLAIRVVSRVKAASGADVGVRDLFTHPTLDAFARVVQSAKRLDARPARSVRVHYPARLSSGQERLWFVSRLDARQDSAYHLIGGLRFTGGVNLRALKAALERVIERHEILRTVFVEEGGVPQAVLVPVTQAYAWHEADLRAGTQTDKDIAALFERLSREPFDLAHGPLLRLAFATISPSDHVLIAAMHHIVADGWSMSVLTSELSILYDRFCTGERDPLPPLPLQYADYAARQRERVEAGNEALTFWQRHLTGAPRLLTLPTDRPRPAVQDRVGASVGFLVDAPLTGALGKLAERHGVTLHMTLIAAYAVLLSRLAGQASVVIGTPVANRPSVELEALIGFFANTLALHIDLSGGPTVAELLAQVRKTALAAYERQEVPFEQVVDAINPPRDRSYDPLVQTMLVWQNTPPGRVTLNAVAVREIHPDVTTAQCDLTLMMEERSGEIAGTAVYATALFERSTIEQYLAAWRALLVAMTHDDGKRVDQFALGMPSTTVAASSREPRGAGPRVPPPATPGVGAATHASHDGPRCLHTRFAARAAAAPDATAVVCDTRALSYGELNAASNRLARHLRTIGVAPGGRVVLAVPRGVELAIAILAILKAGGAYVPIEPALPDDRRREIVADCAPSAVLIAGQDSAMSTAAASTGAALIDLLADAVRWARQPATDLPNEDVGVTERDPAYVIYTSGSTGRPKGVVVEHAPVVSLLAALQPVLEVNASDVWTLFHSIAFDFSVWELFGALLSGARVVVVPHDVARAPEAFYTLICRECVTVLSQTPSAFRLLIDAQERAPLAHRLRHVVFGGERLDPLMLKRWCASSTRRDTTFTDMYGITECTIFTTWRTLAEDDAQPDAPRHVGRAIAGRRVYVLDEHLRPVQPGVAGEIWIGGEGGARGYLDRPALTSQRFLPDPFAEEPGARMHRSGDLGRWLAGGELEYLGRADAQVKIRGFRIEPREIATRLEAHPAIGQSVVRALEQDAGGRQLVAYFTVRETAAAPSPKVLRTYLSEHLPDYMTPAGYVCVDVLPLTINGKIDHAALPRPGTRDYAVHAYEAPCGDTETWLADAWSALLGVERIGRYDDFFELGGHSLLVAQLMARIRDAFDVDLPMTELFESPVLHGFAARIVDARLAQFDLAELDRLSTRGDWAREGDRDD